MCVYHTLRISFRRAEDGHPDAGTGDAQNHRRLPAISVGSHHQYIINVSNDIKNLSDMSPH